MTPSELVSLYENGFQGYVPSEAADRALADHLRATGRYASAADAISDFALEGRGVGQLTLLYLAAERLYPGCLPGGSQGRGSCVAWSTRNAALMSFCAQLLYGANDQRFAAPEVSAEAAHAGVFSTEGIYWFRRHGRDGWQCSAAAEVATKECGLLVRQPYPDLGIDLTRYNASTEGRWGATLPPLEVRQECARHLCQNATVVSGLEQLSDMLAAGYAVSTCGSDAYFKDPDPEWGVCRRNPRDTWYHAMAVCALDSRPDTVRRWGTPLVGVQNSWGDYLSRQAVVNGTNHLLPVGAFWTPWSDFDGRYMVALGPSVGWPAAQLPDWGLGRII